ncbi:MAG: TraR/DksA C4-type zinc finger protein [Clostridiaceae bacterium]|nr:TraR/DksA C4-type zinc finger protein [Clostridiaceae bacterium]
MMRDENRELWDRCAQFHGHVCGGLTIGYKAALYAMELLKLDFSEDEEVVCISENDACGVDAIQVILGCSIGKGNLLFHMRGKQAFSFYNRKNGEAVRLVLKERPKFQSKEESFRFLQASDPKDLFLVKQPSYQVPERARLFQSYQCDCCGEMTAEHMLRLQGDQKLCLDCYAAYDRFHV